MKKITLEYIKRQAKKRKKQSGITHTEALESVAKSYGFSNWIHCQRSLSQQKTKEVENVAQKFELSFTDWLKKHTKRDSPLGDLASDMLRDKTWPSYDSLDKYRSYMNFKRASNGAVVTLEQAWKSYRAYVKKKNSPTASIRKLNKPTPKNHDPRKIVFVSNASPIHFTKRTVEKFVPGDKTWISWEGRKAIPVTVTEVDDRYYSFIIERPLKKAGDNHYLRLDEVRSTPELACMNYVTS